MIKCIGNTDIHSRHRLSCHCGAVVLELELPDGVVEPHRCNGSLCKRKGAVTSGVPLNALQVIAGDDVLCCYQFNTMTAKHYLRCNYGIYTHHQRRLNPNQYSFNIGCLEGVNPYDLGDI